MKKLLISILLMTTIFAGVFAQGYDIVEAGDEYDFYNNEVYLTAGSPSCIGLIIGAFSAIGEGLGQALTQSANNSDNSNNSNNSTETVEDKADEIPFTFTAGYNYYFNQHLALGAYASYEKFASFSFITIQSKFTVQYGWEHFKFYHSVSGGVLIVPGGGVTGIGDLTYLGMKADFKDFSIFAEGSFPTTAVFKIGASYKF